jgi:glycosyltransferase involved in cell wall biosynthesis
MNVVITLEQRFERTPDGAVWTQSVFSYSFFLRYLAVFDSVRVVARVRDVPIVTSDWKRADGKGVSFADVPYYLGPWQYLLLASEVKKAAIDAVNGNDAVIMRVSSQIASCLQPSLRRTGHPYGLEIVGDPYDTFAPGAIKHPLRPFFRWWFPRQLRHQCADACAIAYVTEYSLQRRYPPTSGAFSTHYSSIELAPSAIVQHPRPPRRDLRTFTLITVGTLAQLYKACDVLINAVALCVREGLNLKLIVVGDGKHRTELQAQAASLGLGDRVYFCGQLPPGDAVRAQLDGADLFVLPSRQEGLPRAMIEAMARGLPCIGSTVGGIPELLPPEDMVPPDDVTALARKIHSVVTNPERRLQMSVRNLEKAKDYTEEILSKRRFAFYQYIRETTQVWVMGNG